MCKTKTSNIKDIAGGIKMADYEKDNQDMDDIVFEDDDLDIEDNELNLDDLDLDEDEINLDDEDEESEAAEGIEADDSDIDINDIDLSDSGESDDLEQFDDSEADSNSNSLDNTDFDNDDSLDFKLEDTDFDDKDINISDDTTSEDHDIEDIDAEIAKLEQELGVNGSGVDVDDLEKLLSDRQSRESDNNEFTADDNGSVIDGSTLLEDESEDNYSIVSRDADFISPTGEIVVMDPADDENNFKLIYVDIENIAIVKRIRASNNVEDLVKSIKSTGLLKPVDVAGTSADGVYVLLDGYRRVLACARAGKRRIPCVVNTRVSVPEIPILEAMYNHSKKYTIQEMIDYIDYLEKQKGIMSASMIEYLLQMNSGDYTKLKDILNDDDEDIVSKLKMGQYTIDMAFKKLEQRRKKESAEEKELKRATKVYEEERDSGVENIAEQGETGDESVALTDDEIKQLAVSAGDLDDIEDESLEELVQAGESIEGFKPHKQDPKYRERLDPTLRKSVLARDENTCRICGIASGMEFVETLDVHHIQEVYLGGNDDIDNLITACTVCHKLIHMHGRGELHMRPIQEFSESEQKRFKKIIKLGNKIRLDMKMKGMKVDQLKKLDNTSTIGRTKPGTGQEAG